LTCTYVLGAIRVPYRFDEGIDAMALVERQLVITMQSLVEDWNAYQAYRVDGVTSRN
jgi:hypothetical protein